MTSEPFVRAPMPPLPPPRLFLTREERNNLADGGVEFDITSIEWESAETSKYDEARWMLTLQFDPNPEVENPTLSLTDSTMRRKQFSPIAAAFENGPEGMVFGPCVLVTVQTANGQTAFNVLPVESG